MLSLAASASFYPIERANADKLPRLFSRDASQRKLNKSLSLEGDRHFADRPNTDVVAPSLNYQLPTPKNPPLQPQSNRRSKNHWYAGGSAGVTFLGDLNVSQQFDPLQNGVSQFNLQLRNLGDILSQLDQSQFAQIIRISLLDSPVESNQSLDNLTPQQAGNLAERLANNPASARSVLREAGISAQTFSNLLTAAGRAFIQPETRSILPANLRSNPAQIARLNRLGQDLNLLGELLRRSQSLSANNGNNDGNTVESKSAVRTSSGIGLGTFIGYKFDNVRVEAEFFYSSNSVNKIKTSSPINGESDAVTSGNISNTTIAINGYYDIPVNWQLKPFIGAGIGVSYLSTSGLDLGFGQAIAIDRQPLFTYQLKAGFSLPIDEGTDLFMQYRYLNTAGFSNSNSDRGIPITSKVDNVNLQSLEIGARFGI
jgi:opacity protein-like surface antigen